MSRSSNTRSVEGTEHPTASRCEVIWDGCKRVSVQNVAGWLDVPVRVLPS